MWQNHYLINLPIRGYANIFLIYFVSFFFQKF